MEIKLETETQILVPGLREELWELYEKGFGNVSTRSPCRQSFKREEFDACLDDSGVFKIIAKSEEGIVVGLCMKTHDLSKVDWLNEDFFKQNFPNEYECCVMYVMAVVVGEHAMLTSIRLVREAIRTVPEGGLCCFDFSQEINPNMLALARKAGKAMLRDEKVLDSQTYYCFTRTSV